VLPADTEVGVAEFVVIRSDWVAVATTSEAVAALFAEFGSVTPEFTTTVSLIAVPAAVPAATVTTNVIVAGEPGANDGSVHVSVASVQVQPDGPERETPVVFVGSDSVTVMPVAVLGPVLLTTCVYVMLLPACTGTGLAESVMPRFAEAPTCTLAEALLLLGFGSVTADVTESVCVIVVPDATFEFTATTKVKFAVVFAASDAMVQLGGVVVVLQLHVPGPVSETTVAFVGTGSLNVTVVAVAGPAFVTLCV
jgi:hypothetical protein